MRAVVLAVETGAFDPAIDDPGILPCGDMWTVVMPAGKQEAASQATCRDPALHRRSRQFRNLELYWPAGFPLNDNGPVSDTPADANVFNSQRNEIASTQFAIDR